MYIGLYTHTYMYADSENCGLDQWKWLQRNTYDAFWRVGTVVLRG